MNFSQLWLQVSATVLNVMPISGKGEQVVIKRNVVFAYVSEFD